MKRGGVGSRDQGTPAVRMSHSALAVSPPPGFTCLHGCPARGDLHCISVEMTGVGELAPVCVCVCVCVCVYVCSLPGFH